MDSNGDRKTAPRKKGRLKQVSTVNGFLRMHANLMPVIGAVQLDAVKPETN